MKQENLFCIVVLICLVFNNFSSAEELQTNKHEPGSTDLFNVGKLIHDITRDVRRGHLKNRGKATLMNNKNTLVQHDEDDDKPNLEENIKQTQEEGRKADREEHNKMRNEDVQKKFEENGKRNILRQKKHIHTPRKWKI